MPWENFLLKKKRKNRFAMLVTIITVESLTSGNLFFEEKKRNGYRFALF